MTSYRLYVDELGISHPSNFKYQPYYILMGCIIDENLRSEIKILADQIKFKYWGRTDIVFHSVDMGKNTNDYAIFRKNPAYKEEFINDLLTFLSRLKVYFTVCIINKESIIKKGWDEKKIVGYTAQSVMKSFLAKITANLPCKGRMIFEISNGFKDRIYLETFNYMISPDFSRHDHDYNFQDVRSTITSINFVTKQNHDIETQISDIFSYAAKCKVLSDKKARSFITDSYESKIISILENKLLKTPINASPAKKKYLNKIKSFEIVS